MISSIQLPILVRKTGGTCSGHRSKGGVQWLGCPIWAQGEKDEEEDGGEGGDTINGNPVSKDDSIELSNLRDRLESLENEK